MSDCRSSTRRVVPRSLRRAPLLLGVAILFASLGAGVVRAEGRLSAVEREFREAIQRVGPATVICVPRGVPPGAAGMSSGVLISPDGIVLSDGDAGLRFVRRDGSIEREWRSDVEVRVQRPGGYRAYPATVLHRDRDADTSVLRILQSPAQGFAYVPLADSDDVRVGDFAFALGTAFDPSDGAPPVLTAGVIASYDPLASNDPRGRYEYLYTTAAINVGVNGGPLVDLDGRLVGTVSTYLDPDPGELHQFLGKIIPINRIRSVHAVVPTAAAALRGVTRPTSRSGPGRALETAFRAAARAGWPSVVSIEVDRDAKVSSLIPFERPEETIAHLPHYQGPVSGVTVSEDGYVVTSLYGLTNVGELAEPLWHADTGASVAEGLAAIRGLTVHFPNGPAAGRIVGVDNLLGVVLVKADTARLGPVPAARPAGPDALQAGRFVLALGNPFGRRRPPDPVMTFGILSKLHAADTSAAWRGQWQTDAPGLDTNAGGAAVDLDGRLLGMVHLWLPARHGRSSGISFVVPWPEIRAILPALKEGRGRERGFLGISFDEGAHAAISGVIEGTAAERAGLLAGDVITRIGREEIVTKADLVSAIGFCVVGERIRIEVRREGRPVVVEAVLGRRDDG